MSSKPASTTRRPDDTVSGDPGDGERPGETTSDRTNFGAAAPATTRRLSRRRVIVAGGVVTVALIAGGLVAVNGAGGDDEGGDAGDTATEPTAAVERRSLEEHTDLDGTLGYGDVTKVHLAAQGTITGLAPLGAVVDRGQTLLAVDSRPVPLLFGEQPMWRALGPSAGDGIDVQQLEANLVALGVVTPSELTVDQTWTSATTDAVEEWQESRGLDRTGVVAPGDIVFLPGAVRVAEHPAPVGGAAGGSVLGVTSTTQVVTVDLEATRRSLVETGKPVVVVLPDGTEVTGRVYTVGEVATGDTSGGDDGSGGGGDGDPPKATIDVVITIDDPAALTDAAFDQAPVTVQVVTSAAEDVLAVPVEALLVPAEGGYAVELVHDDGTTSLAPVELGAFADGWVEITGDVAEGDQVEVPE